MRYELNDLFSDIVQSIEAVARRFGVRRRTSIAPDMISLLLVIVYQPRTPVEMLVLLLGWERTA